MMSRHSVVFLMLLILGLAAVSCGEVPGQAPAGGATAVPTPAGSVPGSWPAEAQPLVDRVLAEAAEVAKVAPGQVEVIAFKEEQWPNSCLGCAKEGQTCLQVITPGYRVVVRVGDDEYEYHTDMKGNIVSCLADTAARDLEAVQPLLELVLGDLANRLGVDKSEVDLVRVEEKQWPDSSLGCPQPGKSYLMVVTPGFQIVLEVGGRQYDYRTDMKGHFVLCEQAAP